MRGLLSLFAITSVVVIAGSGRADDAQADAELKALAQRAEAGADPEKLRQDLLAYRQAHPGTRQAVAAAGLWHDLSSALDKFDPATIPPLERFDWHPPELVAILGEP